jgi:hypothetical protein
MQLVDPEIDKEARKKILKGIERYWERASLEAQPRMGEEWDDILEQMGKDKEIEAGVRQEDFYHLASGSYGELSDEWLVEVVKVILLRPEQTCEAEGWPRKKPELGNVAKQVGILKRLYVEGLEYLEDMGVYKNMSADREKEKPVSKNPSY